MPYIQQNFRPLLDPKIDSLADEILKIAQENGYNTEEGISTFATGLVNYSVTKVVKKVGGLDKPRYWKIALWCGTIHNVADELYRRIGHKYEDEQIVKNGDVY